jgi:hypothetical protein
MRHRGDELGGRGLVAYTDVARRVQLVIQRGEPTSEGRRVHVYLHPEDYSSRKDEDVRVAVALYTFYSVLRAT